MFIELTFRKSISVIINHQYIVSEEASQTALTTFLCKIHLDNTCRNSKGSNAMVCLNKRARFSLEQTRQRIIIILLCVYSCLKRACLLFTVKKNSPFQLLQHALNFQMFLLFLLILKHIQKVFKTFLGYFFVWYEMFTTTLFQLADQSMT